MTSTRSARADALRQRAAGSFVILFTTHPRQRKAAFVGARDRAGANPYRPCGWLASPRAAYRFSRCRDKRCDWCPSRNAATPRGSVPQYLFVLASARVARAARSCKDVSRLRRAAPGRATGRACGRRRDPSGIRSSGFSNPAARSARYRSIEGGPPPASIAKCQGTDRLLYQRCAAIEGKSAFFRKG